MPAKRELSKTLLPEKVGIIEVCPRDGLQAEKKFIPTTEKIALIDKLSQTGLARIEVTSFVHPKAVPQLADANQVLRNIHRVPGVKYSALVPNLIGAKRAAECSVDAMDFVVSASETHNLKNVGMTIEESLRELESVAEYCLSNSSGVLNVYISTALGCHYEGKIAAEKVVAIAERVLEIGASEIIIADSTGMANPRSVQELLTKLGGKVDLNCLSVHFHNTRGLGLANLLSALQYGVTRFEASVGGLGGCPFIPGAAGNIPTEEVVYMLEEMGINTGVNLKGLISCTRDIEKFLGRSLPSRIMKVFCQ